MAFLRVYVVVSILLIIGLAVAYLRSEDRRYLRWAVRVLLASLVVALLFFAVLVADRVFYSP